MLSTVFNLVPTRPQLQFSVFKTILGISQEYNLYEYISAYFKSVGEWLKEWNVPQAEQGQIWASIIAMAEKAEDPYPLFLLSLSWLPTSGERNSDEISVNCIVC